MVETQSVKVAEMWSGFAVSDCTGKKNNEKISGFLPSWSNSWQENQSASVMP